MKPKAPQDVSVRICRGTLLVWLLVSIIPNGVIGFLLGLKVATNLSSLDNWSPPSFIFMALFLQLASSIWLALRTPFARTGFVVSMLGFMLLSLAISGASFIGSAGAGCTSRTMQLEHVRLHPPPPTPEPPRRFGAIIKMPVGP